MHPKCLLLFLCVSHYQKLVKYTSINMSEICLICLKTTSELFKVGNGECDNKDILQKLMECVPELDWNCTFQVCSYCCQRLYDVHSFKSLCINSYNWYWSLKTIGVKEEAVVKNENTDCKELIQETLIEEESLENNILSDNDGRNDSDSNSDTDFKELLVEKTKKKEKKEKKSESTRVPCHICGKQYASKYVLKKHIIICEMKHDSNDKEEQKTAPSCLECGITFKNKYMQKRHFDNVHNIKDRKFICEICNRSFATKVYLEAHKRYHSGDRPHVCSFCGKGYITASDLYHHEKIHANKRNYRCEICPKAFNTSSDLYKHKMCVHMDPSQWKYTCEVCEKKFPLKINLDSHTKTHTGERNFPCNFCDRKCINMSVLKRHIITHSRINPFRCEICDQGYKFQKSLDIHKSKAHGIGDVKIKPVVKKFQCPLCVKAYTANNKLQKHLRAHVGEKPFKCPECHKGFSDKSYIKLHLKTLHNIPNDEKISNISLYAQ
ncbi:zinc finger protein 558-like isoform X2 [Diorhabda carinulata]|uniref:zinc finger protein 558-like isoform X2 n=1 Tax=Diorhabda carinulata TaxID=1163345 RepID=UPI0025A1C81F|nr:zinc finger protein 558-like isoform X2 [Diorhabda carinulata]